MDGSPHNAGEIMENQTSFDLNSAVRRWRAGMEKSSSFQKDDLDELESHVRDSAEALRTHGLTDEESFLIAIRRTGSQEQLAAEFSTINRSTAWLDRILWLAIGWIGSPVLFAVWDIAASLNLPAGLFYVLVVQGLIATSLIVLVKFKQAHPKTVVRSGE